MSLDEIAAQNRKNRQTRGRSRLRHGRVSRVSSSQRGRYNSYNVPHNTYRQRRYTNKQSQRGVRKPLSSTGRRLLLTNLNKELTNDKLKVKQYYCINTLLPLAIIRTIWKVNALWSSFR